MSKLSSLRRPSRRFLGFVMNPAFFCAGIIVVILAVSAIPVQNVIAQTSAVADIKIDGSDGPVTMAAPATFTVSWTSSNTANCQVSGTMGSTMGQPIPSNNGSQQISGLAAADYTFTISCDGTSDSVVVHVNQPAQQTQTTTQYTGMCAVRRPDVALPATIPFQDIGRNYAKINKGTVANMTALLPLCTGSDFSTLLEMYCGRYQDPVTFEAVLYDANNSYSDASGVSVSVTQSCSVVTPLAPSGLTVTASLGKNVLNWTDNSSNETNFKIYKLITGLWTEIGTVGANVTTYTDSSVTPGTSYDYKVQAYNQQGNYYPIYSGVSNVVTVVSTASATGAGTGSGTPASNPVTVDIKINNQDGPLTLTAPTNYTATWTSTNATSCVTSGTWGNTNKGTSGSWQFNSVSVVAQNTYGITCTGANGTVTDSVVVNVIASQTTSSSGTGTSSLTSPNAPSGMTAALNNGSVKLTWVNNSTNANGFKLYKIKNGSWTDLTNVGAGVTTYTDTDVAAGQTYYYRVQSFIQSANSFAYSPVSNTATVTIAATASTSTAAPATSTTTTSSSVSSTPTTTSSSVVAPAAPSNLTVVPSSNYIVLKWTDNSNNETGFKLYKIISGGWTEIANVSANTTQYTDTNVTVGVNYYYKVQAFNQPTSGAYPLYSAVSNIVSVTIGTPLVQTPTTTSQSLVTPTTTPVTTAPTTTAVTTATVTGTLIDANGQPVAKVGIHAYNPDFSINSQAVTGSSGTYNIMLVPGSYSVEVLLPTDRTDLVKPAQVNISVTAGQVLNQSFQLKALAAASKAVSGSVRTIENKVITDAVVKAVSQTTGQWLTAPVSGDGTYYLKLSPGAWNVSVMPATTTAATWVWQSQPFVITLADNSTAETATINFTVTALTAKVTITAVDEQGASIPAAGVGIAQASAAVASQSSQFKKTDAAGIASFMVMPGSFTLHFFAPTVDGFVNPSDQNFSIAIGEEKTVSVVFKKPQTATAVTVGGSAKMQSGTAISEAAVWAWSEQGGTASANSDADGAFVLTLAVGQRWHIGAGKVIAGYAYKSAETVVDAVSQTAPIPIILLQVSSKPLPDPVSVSKPATEPVIAQSSSGAGVVVPAGAAPSAQSVRVDVKPTVEVPSQEAARVVGTVYDISMKDQAEQPVTSLESDVEITLPYTREDLLKQGISEDRLAPSYYEESVGAWVKIDNFTVDKQNHRIVLHVRHFTRFALVAPADVTPPLAPLNVKGYRTGKTQVTLTWTDPKVDFHHTKVYRSESSKSIGLPVATMETGSFFEDTAVKASKRYYYRLVAVDAAGNESGFTAALSVRVSGAIKKLPQPPKNTAFTKYLSKGRKDTEVKYLQQTLQTLGFLPVSGEVTGTFDDATVVAVKQYQQSQGLKQSGALDTLTRKALNKV